MKYQRFVATDSLIWIEVKGPQGTFTEEMLQMVLSIYYSKPKMNLVVIKC